MHLNAIREIKILTKISESSVSRRTISMKMYLKTCKISLLFVGISLVTELCPVQSYMSESVESHPAIRHCHMQCRYMPCKPKFTT